jgi:hypothetical protein
MPFHDVQQGETLLGLAAANGLESWEDILGRPENAELKKKRTDPGILKAGDRVFIPNREMRHDRTVTVESMRRLHAASGARSDSDAPDLRSGIGEGFRAERGTTFTTSHPLAKAVLVVLAGVWPRAVAFDDLMAEARGRLAAAGWPRPAFSSPASGAKC